LHGRRALPGVEGPLLRLLAPARILTSTSAYGWL
jgi:hypothetical protein